ncbi:Glutaredoxin [Musa troglodytarum]|uniref:Glutaredoxin n=1 Tax=Musa troglodytarum TaxID=320322 RepID=A0A9E7G700_9LILI|nr:Glutaredoxin [Musa troglodytarum]
MDRVMRLASQKAVVIFSLSSCCMCHTIKRLFCELGVNPAVYELDEDPRGREMEKALVKLLGRNPSVPVVFIGGKLVGSTDRVMALHLGGKLTPLLREAGFLPSLKSSSLWLCPLVALGKQRNGYRMEEKLQFIHNKELYQFLPS